MKDWVLSFFAEKDDDIFLITWYKKIIFFEWIAVFGLSSWIALVVATILQ
jgi:hypothetical protein